MIQIKDLCLSFKQQTIFDDVSFTLDQDDRVGLVGLNGSGKSTLLKILAGQQKPDSGNITIVGEKKLAYMPQEVVLLSDKTVLSETLTAFTQLDRLQQDAAALEKLLAANSASHKEMERYAEIQQELVFLNPSRLLGEAQKMLIGLGFSLEQLAKPVGDLSVGWKMRVVLAKLLLQNADFYLFDEPTNHLDIVAKDWFVNFLKSAQFGFLLVCHERYFLDQVCDKILDLERGKATFYKGGYSAFEKQKEYNLAQLEAAYAAQQKEIKHKTEVASKFQAGTRAKQAQSLLRSIDKMERIEIPPSAKTINFRFPPITQSGRTVLTVKNLSQQFGTKKIFENVSFEVERGQKVAIVAANGVGKTTLFNTIIGSLPKQSGSIEFGYNVTSTIFDQDQNKSLNLNKSIIENVELSCQNATQPLIRSFLGSFLFTSDDVHKKIGVLSGGEKNRVGMVCVLLKGANLFLLDEPTNHLDIPSKEVLLRALNQFEGTILFVSHDHDFINRLATRVIELTPHGVHSYDGNYDSYLYQKKAMFGESDSDEGVKNQSRWTEKQAKVDDKKQRLQEKEAKKLEDKIATLEKQIVEAKHQFEGLSWSDFRFVALEDKLKALEKQKKQAVAEWERILATLG